MPRNDDACAPLRAQNRRTDLRRIDFLRRPARDRRDAAQRRRVRAAARRNPPNELAQNRFLCRLPRECRNAVQVPATTANVHPTSRRNPSSSASLYCASLRAARGNCIAPRLHSSVPGNNARQATASLR